MGCVARSCGVLLAAMLAGCIGEEETGFVQIKAVPTFVGSQPTFYLNDTKLAPLKNGEALLVQKTGTSKLDLEGSGGQLSPLCEIVVRKNRITTVTISTALRPRCLCNHAAGQDPKGQPANRTCVS